MINKSVILCIHTQSTIIEKIAENPNPRKLRLYHVNYYKYTENMFQKLPYLRKREDPKILNATKYSQHDFRF